MIGAILFFMVLLLRLGIEVLFIKSLRKGFRLYFLIIRVCQLATNFILLIESLVFFPFYIPVKFLEGMDRFFEVCWWQIKRHTLSVGLVALLCYIAHISYNKIGFFEGKDFLSNVVFEALVMGFIGSLLFLIFMFSLRPNIKIADKICYDAAKDMYYFKMVNMSLFFTLKDVIVSIEHSEIVEALGDGNNIETNDVHIKTNSLSHVHSITTGWENKLFAFIVQSNGKIKNGIDKSDEILIIDDITYVKKETETKQETRSIVDVLDKQHNYIELSVYARHSLSGFSIQKTQIYKNKRHLEAGEYQTGISVDIIQNNP